MVGLVVVSHSRALADAAVALAAEMLHDASVRISVAAGLADSFGTDAVAIADAITEADGGDGVVVLMDLGSAVLSAELALELLTDDELRDRVVLCPGPLVEGLVTAAVTAAGGASRDEVAAEAAHALTGKEVQLGGPPPALMSTDEAPAAVLKLTNRHGLHARPAARLVSAARAAGMPIEIRNRTTGSAWVPATSLSRVATLGALQGHELEIRGPGPEAAAAIAAIVALSERAFDEPDPEPATPPSIGPGTGAVTGTGTETGTRTGTDPGTDPGTGTGPGTDPGISTRSGPRTGTGPTTGTGPGPGTGPGTGHRTGRVQFHWPLEIETSSVIG